MSKNKDRWSIKDILGGLIGGVLIAIVGARMIINPIRENSSQAEGGGNLIGDVLNYIWSTPGGIALVIVGLLISGASVHQVIQQSAKK